MTDEQRALLYPVILSDYNPAWPRWFEEEKTRLTERIGAAHIVRITHIGSTAVPGLLAKPTVDVLLEIAEGVTAEQIIAALTGPDYIALHPPDMPTPPPHLMIIKGYLPTGFAEQVFHIHVRYAGAWDEPVFRDRLRANPQAAADYAALKRSLLTRYQYDRDGYTAAKGAFIRKIMEGDCH